MRYLGIDFGTKRLGLAISEPLGSFAFPLAVIENTENLIKDVAGVCAKNDIGEIVVGESRDFAQKENGIMKDVRLFVKELEEELKIPVHLHPEFLTSLEASQIQGTNDMNDASAAAIILKSYLDLKNNK